MCALVLFLSVVSVQALDCYINGPSGQLITYTVTEPNMMCTTYNYKCVAGDSSCTAEEVARGTIKSSFTVVSSDTCNQMKAMPNRYMNVNCCSTDLCNKAPSSNGSKTAVSIFTVLVLLLGMVVVMF